MKHGISLAWLQLAKEKRSLLAAVGGIAFAVVLMLVQLGFKAALLNSVGLLYSHLRADIALVNPEYQYVVSPKHVSKRRIYQALGFEGVESVAWLNCIGIPWKNPLTHEERDIYLVGFKPSPGVFDVSEIETATSELRKPGAVLFDSLSRPEFGPIAEKFRDNQPVVTEISGRQVEVAGLFSLGTSFAVDGTVLTSDVNFFRIVPWEDPNLASIGLVRLRPGVDPEKVRAQLAASLPKDVMVLTRQGLVDLERSYWDKNTPVGFVFNLGLVMSLFVGSIIVYQILYTDVSNHLSEYATLKAMGYTDRELFSIVLNEALILSVLGFLPGLAVSVGVYRIAANATLLPLQLTLLRVVFVYALTAFMCALSGAFAMTKLRSADPAEIF